jgi:hypothetical protein
VACLGLKNANEPLIKAELITERVFSEEEFFIGQVAVLVPPQYR